MITIKQIRLSRDCGIFITGVSIPVRKDDLYIDALYQDGAVTKTKLDNSQHYCGSELYNHYCDVIMGAIAAQITSLTIVYSTVYSDADPTKHQSSASLAFVRGIHRGPVNSPHKGPVTRKMFPFDDVMHPWAWAYQTYQNCIYDNYIYYWIACIRI